MCSIFGNNNFAIIHFRTQLVYIIFIMFKSRRVLKILMSHPSKGNSRSMSLTA